MIRFYLPVLLAAVCAGLLKAEVPPAPKPTPAIDHVQNEMDRFREEMHQQFGDRHWDQLEKVAVDLRAEKARFGNGSWKLPSFYDAFIVGDEFPDSVWQVGEKLHLEWLDAKPNSVTALIAYANFLAEYGYYARGTGFASSVTEKGWQLYHERLDACGKVLVRARALPEKDPMWWSLMQRIALGNGWSTARFDKLVAEAHAAEPTYWRYDTARAISLMPRWYGEPGDWEAYAMQAAQRPAGVGAEVYARIVIFMMDYHKNIFRETQASWPKTREGLEQLCARYPEALEFPSYAALLATLAADRPTARAMFEKLGDQYLARAWSTEARFTYCRQWAALDR